MDEHPEEEKMLGRHRCEAFKALMGAGIPIASSFDEDDEAEECERQTDD